MSEESSGKRPSRPRAVDSVGDAIEDLPFAGEVDEMLLGGVPVSDVAKYIRETKNEMKSRKLETVERALYERRTKKREEHGVPDPAERLSDLMNYRRFPVTPTNAVRGIYDRTEGGIKEMLELEGAYLAARDRVDRMLELEALSGQFTAITTQAVDSMVEILFKRAQVRAKFNLGEGEDLESELTLRGYSEETIAVLRNPEARHRILSVFERMARFGRGAISLPLPASSTVVDEK